MKKGRTSGYPPEYLRAQQRFVAGFILLLLAIGAAMIFLAYNAIYSSGPLELAVGVSAVFLFVLWVFYASITSPIRLAIYFEEKVAGHSPWSVSLARNCLYLDELCVQSKVATLSSFGFTDDWSGETMIWHAPEKGLQTVTTLLNQLNRNPDILAESASLIADLQKMKQRLQTAQQDQTNFCFILHGDGSNLMEIEQRCGYF